MTKHPLLVLVDGSSYLYRAFHALPPLATAQGEPTGAMYGVLNMLRKLLTDYSPDYVGIIFDSKGKTFRDDLYAEYKSNRPSMPDDLSCQIKPLLAIIKAMGLPLLIIDHVEADDVIGTLTKQAEAKGWHVLISTGDKDMAQLVTKKTTLINTMSNTLLDPPGVVKKFGLPAELMIDYFALTGDPVDNIPGVPGVGPKTAVKWLTEYGDLDKLIKNADKIGGKIGERLREHLSELPLWRTLVTIKCDVALDFKPEDLTRAPENIEQLRDFYQVYEFKTWLKTLTETQPSIKSTPQVDYICVHDKAAFSTLLHALEKAQRIAFSLRTSTLDDPFSGWAGLSICVTPHQAYYVPLNHREASLELQDIIKDLKKIFEGKTSKIFHQLKEAETLLHHHEIQLSSHADDILLESYALHTTNLRHDLASLAQQFLHHTKFNEVEFAGRGQKQLSFSQIPLEKATQFSAQEADFILQIHDILEKKLKEAKTLKKLYETIDLPLARVLSRMEFNGVLIDKQMLEQQSTELETRIKTLENKIFKLSNTTFNIASPKQLQDILYEKLKLPIIKKTATGQPSTAEDVLEELAYEYPLPKLILEYRGFCKLKSTYTDRLPEQINSKTGRVHTSYNQAGTSTGRLSSSNPNLQNIPVRTEEGRRIRQAFIASPHAVILAADYSQIELRLMAHFSDDTRLKQAYADNLDIHRTTAAEVLGISPHKVTPEQRRQAKVINFGILYGMSAFGLSRELSIPRESAQQYIDFYFQRYPGVKAYLEKTREFAHQNGYVETLFGRKLVIPEINVQNLQRRRAAERAAINGPLQGTAADIIKRAMIRIDEWLNTQGLNTKMVMQVHDELVFEVPTQELANLKPTLTSMMTDVPELSVPLMVEVAHGKNWDEAH